MCPAPLVYLASGLMDTVGYQLRKKMVSGFFGCFYSKALFFFRKDVTIMFSVAASSVPLSSIKGSRKTACGQQLRCSHGQAHRPRSRQVLVFLETRVLLYPACFFALYPKCLRKLEPVLAAPL